MARTEPLPDMPVLEERVPKVPSGSSRIAKAERPHGHGKPMARNQRSHLELPVIVCGHSPNEEPLHEEARTLVVYPCGALIALDATVELGQELVLVNPKTKAEAACHVVGIESNKSGCRIAGVQESIARNAGCHTLGSRIHCAAGCPPRGNCCFVEGQVDAETDALRRWIPRRQITENLIGQQSLRLEKRFGKVRR